MSYCVLIAISLYFRAPFRIQSNLRQKTSDFSWNNYQLDQIFCKLLFLISLYLKNFFVCFDVNYKCFCSKPRIPGDKNLNFLLMPQSIVGFSHFFSWRQDYAKRSHLRRTCWRIGSAEGEGASLFSAMTMAIKKGI